MTKYFNTNGIYNGCSDIRLEVCYEKGKGYVANISPCHRENGSFGVVYSGEYFKYYQSVDIPLVECGRKSEKKFAEACKLAEQKTKDLIQSYVDTVCSRGGRHIEVLDELN